MTALLYDAAQDMTACGRCKGDQHGSCTRVACTCQLPQCVRLRTPRPPAVGDTKEPSMPPHPTGDIGPSATAVLLERREAPPGPAPAPAEHPCPMPGCGRTFSRPNGLSRHLNEGHGRSSNEPAPAARKRHPPPSPRPPSKPSTTVPTPPAATALPAPAEAEARPVLPETLLHRPGEWVQIGHVELETRQTAAGTGVFARYVPADPAA